MSADLIPALAAEHAIDVYVDEPSVRRGAAGRSAHDFVWAHRLAPYDLTLYQVGNSSAHDYLFPYVFRFPGLAVLHDLRLHHARAAALLRHGRTAAYRAEFAWNHPGVSPDAAELAVAGFDSQLYYGWPMTRLVALASRSVAVHTAVAREELRVSAPEAHVDLIRLGHGVALPHDAHHTARVRGRQRWGVPETALVVGCFGGLTPDKRIPQVLAAFAATLRYLPTARLLLAGAAASHYDLPADVERHGVSGQTTITGYLSHDEELTDAVAACDVGVTLRWPTAGEMSGPWLRCLALGKPTIILDLAHMAAVPSLDPRTWQPHDDDEAAPVAVAVDLLDEDHSLRLALRRLATDAALRDRLGRSGLAHWRRLHTVDSMVDDYRAAIARALERPGPQPALPAHLTDDGTGVMRSTLERFGLASPLG